MVSERRAPESSATVQASQGRTGGGGAETIPRVYLASIMLFSFLIIWAYTDRLIQTTLTANVRHYNSLAPSRRWFRNSQHLEPGWHRNESLPWLEPKGTNTMTAPQPGNYCRWRPGPRSVSLPFTELTLDPPHRRPRRQARRNLHLG